MDCRIKSGNDEIEDRSRDAFQHPSYAKPFHETRRHRVIAVRRTASFHLSFPGGPCRNEAGKRSVESAAQASLPHDERKKRTGKKSRKRNADRRKALLPRHFRARPRLEREAHICRRSTAALARETLVSKAQRQARLPGTRQERSVLYARPNRGAKTLRSSLRALPALACPSPARHLAPRS
jgi:hypothetical protein